MDNRKIKKPWLTLWLAGMVLALFVAFTLTRQAPSTSFPSNKIPSDATSDFGLMAEAWNAIHAHYVDKSAEEPRTLTYGSISGMVDALGDTGHSVFLSPEMIKEEETFIKGQYQGIGLEVRMKAGHVVIVTPFDGSPAQKSGLLPGEIIMDVNGRNVMNLTLLQVVHEILGPVGTQVTLTVMDPKTGATRKVTMTRASITINSVSWHRLPGTEVAHLRIARFSEGMTKDLKKALKEIQQQGLKCIVLDLRNNPGGIFREAVSTASQFLSGGNVLLIKNAEGRIKPVGVEKGGLAKDIPMVVLVNGGTASAAEIVAGALQDAGRARLVGETTFGTGTVLQEFPLSDGSALLLAVEEWLTPDGHTFWHKGITPNLVVALPEGVFPVLPEEEIGMTPRDLQNSKDSQLLDALNLVSGKKYFP
jgi:carboxyl-terminal processing protease